MTQRLQNRLAALARESREDGDRNSAQQEGLPTSKSAPAEMGQATPPTPSTDPPPAKRARPDETPRKYTILRRDGPSTDPNIRRRMPVAPYVSLSMCVYVWCSLTSSLMCKGRKYGR